MLLKRAGKGLDQAGTTPPSPRAPVSIQSHVLSHGKRPVVMALFFIAMSSAAFQGGVDCPSQPVRTPTSQFTPWLAEISLPTVGM